MFIIADTQGSNRIGMTSKFQADFPTGQVPDLDRMVRTADDCQLPCRTYRDCCYHVGRIQACFLDISRITPDLGRSKSAGGQAISLVVKTKRLDDVQVSNPWQSILALPLQFWIGQSCHQLSRGDMLAFEYGAGPVRRTLHRLSEPVAADAAGETPVFEVRPHFEPGAVAGGPVELVKPAAFMRIVPQSLTVGEVDDFGSVSIGFSILQRLHP